MFKKTIVFVALMSLLLAGCSGAVAGASPSAAATGLTVSGHGDVSIQPDVAYVTIGVHTQAEDVSQAVSQNATQVSSVMAAMADLGVAQTDMQTSNFSLYTGQSYDTFGQPTGIQYTVDNTVNVTVRDLPKMGELLDAAISAGANSIYGVSFDLDDKTQAQGNARDIAVANAVDEAQALAAAAGVSLGEIISINYTYNSGIYYYPQYGMGGGGDAAAASTSIVPGMISVSADVSITYAIK